MPMTLIQRRALTFAIAGAGGAAFLMLRLPLPLLLGPMLAAIRSPISRLLGQMSRR